MTAAGIGIGRVDERQAGGLVRRVAVVWHLLTVLAVGVGVVWQLVLVLRGTSVLVPPGGRPPATGTMVGRFFSYFTIESNILVAVTAAALAVRPDRDGRLWRVLRLMGLFGISVTGVISATLLRGLLDLHGAAAVTNALLHEVGPGLAVVGWLLFGPRRRITENTLVVSMVWPVLYVAWTFVHGARSGWYPYPFIDQTALGYPTVIRNGAGVVVFLVGVGALFLGLDRHLPPVLTGSLAGADRDGALDID